MKKFNKIYLISLVVANILFSSELDIANLLQDIEKKTDLSEKTKMENGGVYYIYTREDIRKMQAHNLKDILKSTYPFGYNENSFGVSDPYTLKTSIPYMSSSIKVYIDNQEITTGLYGSGLSLYGNMDIDFVDHIEVYSGNPTFEFSTEPAFTIIKLYSKVAKKDIGSKVAFSGGSNGDKGFRFYNTNQLENDWSYFSYISLIDNKRTKYDNYNATLSRDSKTVHIFNSFYKNDNKILIDAISSKKDSFIEHSIFATPDDATIDNDYLHIGYDGTYKNLSFLVSFDKYNLETYYQDKNIAQIQTLSAIIGKPLSYKIESDSSSEVYTAGVDYGVDTDSNRFVAGVKYRLKHFKFHTLKINDISLKSSGHSKQTTSTLFFENQYLPTSNQVITTGASLIKVQNNHSNQNDNLYNARIGYTYLNEHLVSKTVASYLEFTIDPYLVNSVYLNEPSTKVPKSKQNIYMQNIKYTQGSNIYEFLASYITIKDALMPNVKTGLLEAYKKSLDITSCTLRYTKEYAQFSKVEISAGINKIDNLIFTNKFMEYSASLRDLHSYNQFDIFNEFLVYRNDYDDRSYCDYSAGIIYNYSSDLSFSLKGTNLFNKAKESYYSRVNPTTYTFDTSLTIAPIDRKILFTVEYTF